MDVSIGLGQAVAAASALLLGLGRSREAGNAVYALAAGRLLLRVRLAGDPRGQEPGVPGALPVRGADALLKAQVASYLASEWTGFEPSEVRLVPSARTRIRRAGQSVVRGFEWPLVRPVAAMVASGVLSFAVAALTLGGGAPGPRVAVPVGPDRPAHARYEDPSRWERDLLLADVGAPAPHTFRRTTGHANVVIAHTNTPVPHSNLGSPHTNNAGTPHSNGAGVPHTNTSLLPGPGGGPPYGPP